MLYFGGFLFALFTDPDYLCKYLFAKHVPKADHAPVMQKVSYVLFSRYFADRTNVPSLNDIIHLFTGTSYWEYSVYDQ